MSFLNKKILFAGVTFTVCVGVCASIGFLFLRAEDERVEVTQKRKLGKLKGYARVVIE